MKGKHAFPGSCESSVIGEGRKEKKIRDFRKGFNLGEVNLARVEVALLVRLRDLGRIDSRDCLTDV
jgi:hypothetical protein